LPPAHLAQHVEKWLDTPTSGGTAIDSEGNIYYSDANRRCILKIDSDKSIKVLVSDPRLIWSDAMPVALLNRLFFSEWITRGEQRGTLICVCRTPKKSLSLTHCAWPLNYLIKFRQFHVIF